MSTKNKKTKSQKVAKESKSEFVKANDLTVDSHDQPANDATSIPSLSAGVPLDRKSTSQVKDKSAKQQADDSKNDINPGSTLEDDIKW